MFVKVVSSNSESEQFFECGKAGFHRGVKNPEGVGTLLNMSTVHHGEIDLWLQTGDQVYMMNTYGKTFDSFSAQ